MQADINEVLHLKLEGKIAKLLINVDPSYTPFATKKWGKTVIYAELNRALYGTLQAVLLFWKDLSKFFVDDIRFMINQYDWCIHHKDIDGKQCTTGWHVNDLTISHSTESIVESILGAINHRYSLEAPLVVHQGLAQEYLGMTIDYSNKGKAHFTMPKYINDLIVEIPPSLEKGPCTTPAATHLFTTNEDAIKLLTPPFITIWW